MKQSTTRKRQVQAPVLVSRKRFSKCRLYGGTSSIWSLRIVSAWLLLCLLPLYSIWRTTIISGSNATNRMWNHDNNETMMDQPIVPATTRKPSPTNKNNINMSSSTSSTPRATRKKESKDGKNNTKEKKPTYLDFYLGARFPNGSLGYVADPAALAQGRRRFLQQQGISTDSAESYWKVLDEYHISARNGSETGDWMLGPDHVCGFGPGQGFEEEGGYKLLVEKVRIHRAKHNAEKEEESEQHASANTSTTHITPATRPVRIMCAIYTYPRMRDLFRTQALSWGYKCDGFLAFSTETIAELGLIDLVHEGPESYQNMWQKVRSLWIYLYHHYGTEYDFFHLGGDDLYMMVENFRKYLQQVQDTTPEHTPVFMGQWIPIGSPKDPNYFLYYVAGAPGYTLNQRALQLLVEEALPECHVNVQASYEDRLISKCMRDLNMVGQDTRERETGQQQYHDCGPGHLFTAVVKAGRGSFHSKLMSYWQGLPHPMNPNITTGSKHGLESAAKYSVNFHNLYHPLYAARIHVMLYTNTCPANSPLGRGLRAHFVD